MPALVLGLLFFLVLYIVPLNFKPLLVPDETRYGEIAREMLASGDWVVPRLNGMRYFEKPPMGYWLDALALGAFGETPFAVRFSSAASTGLMALLVFLLTRRMGGDWGTALLSACIYMSLLLVYLLGTLALLDSVLALFLGAGLMAAFMAARAGRRPVSLGWWVASGIAFGLAFLTKGFLAFAVPVIVLLPWLLWEGRWREIFTRGWLVALAALLLVLPWALMIHGREPDFWHYFFWEEHVKRFFSDDAQHSEPFHFFLIALPALAFPWIMLAPAAAAGLRRGRRGDDRSAMRLLWLWLLIPFAFFSASSGKLYTYILPCFPPLAVLVAIGLSRYLRGGRRGLFDAGNGVVFLVLGTALFMLLASQVADLGLRTYDPDETPRVIVAALALSAGAGASLLAILGRQPALKLSGSVFTFVPFLIAFNFALPNRMLEHKSPRPALEYFRHLVTPRTILVSDGDLAPSLAWFYKRTDVYLISPGEFDYGLTYPQAEGRMLDTQGFTALLERVSTGRPMLLLCEKSCPGHLEDLLPGTAHRHAYGVFVMWHVPGDAG